MYFLNVLLISSISIFTGCAYTDFPHVQAANVVRKKFEKKIEKKNLSVFGVGGAMMDQVQEFSYDLDYIGNLGIEEVRTIIVNTIEDLIKETNKDKNIKKYLKYFPYSENYLYLAINFMKDKRRLYEVDPPFISFVKNDRGELIYKKSDSTEAVYKESYAEAYEKVYGVPLPDRLSQIKDLLEESN